jgi:hypothetical protein
MAEKLNYTASILSELDDAREVIRLLGRSITENMIDKQSTLDNLARAIKKIDAAKHFINHPNAV